MNKLNSAEYVKMVEAFIGEKLPFSDRIFKITTDPGWLRIDYYVTNADGNLMWDGGGPVTACMEYPFS